MSANGTGMAVILSAMIPSMSVLLSVQHADTGRMLHTLYQITFPLLLYPEPYPRKFWSQDQ